MWPWRVKPVRVVSVADVDDKDRFGNSLLQIWELSFDKKKLNFCLDFEHRDWSRFWSCSWGKILKLEFGQYFSADVL